MALVTDPNDPRLIRGVDTEPTPQSEAYLILSEEEERAKGFVRPVRSSYRHVGPVGPCFPLRDLTAEEIERHGEGVYAKFEPYPENESPKIGRFWTSTQLGRVGGWCETITTMSQALAETYARDPGFYGSTYCVRCAMHLPVEEFVWIDDGERVWS